MFSQNSITRLYLTSFLTVILSIAAVGNVWILRTNTFTDSAKMRGEFIEQSQPLFDLQNYVGAQGRSQTDCALAFAGAGLALCAVAIVGAATLGAGAVVTGIALGGAIVPLFSGFC